MIIKGDGYTFNTKTRKLEFGKKVCWNCTGTGKVKKFSSCSKYGQTVTKYEGRKCPECGAKNKGSHSVRMSFEIVECHTCKGTGQEKTNHYSSLDLSPIADTFKLVLFNGKKTFNDSYLGLGNFAGVTGYTAGEYSTAEQIMEHMKSSSGRAFKHVQAGNLVCEDGSVPDTIYVKVSGGGSVYTAMLVGTKFGRKAG